MHRSSILTTLGLRASPDDNVPNLAAHFLIANFTTAYLALAPRNPKQYYHFDHNAAPREDIAKHGDRMVAEGKMSRRALAMVKRWDAAHANAIDNFPLFVAGVLLACHAGVPNARLNGLMASYTLARIAYGIAYVTIETDGYASVRSFCWWWGNVSFLTMLVLAGKRM